MNQTGVMNQTGEYKINFNFNNLMKENKSKSNILQPAFHEEFSKINMENRKGKRQWQKQLPKRFID
jgi:hypothetical protein